MTSIPKQPRDEKGRFVPLDCPVRECGGGRLVHDGGPEWRCDGLVDPGHPDRELQACSHYHVDGEARVAP